MHWKQKVQLLWYSDNKLSDICATQISRKWMFAIWLIILLLLQKSETYEITCTFFAMN